MTEDDLRELKKKLAAHTHQGTLANILTETEAWQMFEDWVTKSLQSLQAQAVSPKLVGDPHKHAMLVGEYEGKRHILAVIRLFIENGRNAQGKLAAIRENEADDAS